MTSAVFLDSNVIVYASDHDDPTRNEIATNLIHGLDRDRTFVSQQVLSEYANVMCHPAKLGRPASEAIRGVRRIAADWTVLPVSTEVVVSALEAMDHWGLHYYDAQIWATAALNRVPIVLSEDFEHGLELGPVRFLDPFSEEFDVAELGA